MKVYAAFNSYPDYNAPRVMIASIEDISNLIKLDPNFDPRQYGEVYANRHEDLILFKYMPTAEYVGNWNFFERVSRGIIFDTQGNIVARPFDKFFNLGQHNTELTSPIKSVSEKVDGSLGIIFYHNNKWRVATNGSLTSEQGQWATQFIYETGIDRRLYGMALEGYTILAEIIYPENRVVVDYGDTKSLVVLAVRHTQTGEYMEMMPHLKPLFYPPYNAHWRIAESFPFDNLEVIKNSLNNLVNAEGYVIECEDGLRVKIKAEEYLKLHRLKFSITPNFVYDLFVNGEIDNYKASVPDEFVDDFNDLADPLVAAYDDLKIELDKIIYVLSERDFPDRKAFAQTVIETYPDFKHLLFAWKDGKLSDTMIRKTIPSPKG